LRSATILLVAVVAACSSDSGTPVAARPEPTPPPAALAAGDSDICIYRKRREPVMTGYRDATGAAWEGEIRPQDVASLETNWLGRRDARVATVLAKPRVDFYRVRVDENCYDPARAVYTSCRKTLEADLRAVRGLARAIDMPDARTLALQLCEKKVRELAGKLVERSLENADLRCTAAVESYCPPPAPPPAPAKK
jgi:hypothetical protein